MFSPVPRVSISCSIWYLRVVLLRSREEQCQRVYEQRYAYTIPRERETRDARARERQRERSLRRLVQHERDVLHPESKQQTTPASPRDALECVAALARTRECRQDCVRFAYRGPQVDRLHVLELKRDVE